MPVVTNGKRFNQTFLPALILMTAGGVFAVIGLATHGSPDHHLCSAAGFAYMGGLLLLGSEDVVERLVGPYARHAYSMRTHRIVGLLLLAAGGSVLAASILSWGHCPH